MYANTLSPSHVTHAAGSTVGNSSFLLGGADTSNVLANTQPTPTTAAMPQGILPMGMADSAALLGSMGMGGALGRAGDAAATVRDQTPQTLNPTPYFGGHDSESRTPRPNFLNVWTRNYQAC
jgi:hypothetical protein